MLDTCIHSRCDEMMAFYCTVLSLMFRWHTGGFFCRSLLLFHYPVSVCRKKVDLSLRHFRRPGLIEGI